MFMEGWLAQPYGVQHYVYRWRGCGLAARSDSNAAAPGDPAASIHQSLQSLPAGAHAKINDPAGHQHEGEKLTASVSDSIPHRVPWNNFPDVIIHAPESSVKKHPAYPEAKAGNADAAQLLVDETVSLEAVECIRKMIGEKRPYLASAHAFERDGVNSIPQAIADKLADLLGLKVERGIVQINVVRHTGSSGFGRLARQALFQGNVTPGAMYFLVDDFIGQGGTLANLRGFIEHEGGVVLGATVLTGKPFSAKISLDQEQLESLRHKHGKNLEDWWRNRFGHTFDCLTQSEARYLERSADVDTIRDRIAEEEQD